MQEQWGPDSISVGKPEWLLSSGRFCFTSKMGQVSEVSNWLNSLTISTSGVCILRRKCNINQPFFKVRRCPNSLQMLVAFSICPSPFVFSALPVLTPFVLNFLRYSTESLLFSTKQLTPGSFFLTGRSGTQLLLRCNTIIIMRPGGRIPQQVLHMYERREWQTAHFLLPQPIQFLISTAGDRYIATRGQLKIAPSIPDLLHTGSRG